MHFEDFNVGDTFVTEGVEVTAEDIVEYARRYDPQPFHLDPEAARESIYGGLIASGFHIFSMAFGAIARTGIFEGGGQGAPGIHDVRWVSPARPGDTCTPASRCSTNGLAHPRRPWLRDDALRYPQSARRPGRHLHVEPDPVAPRTGAGVGGARRARRSASPRSRAGRGEASELLPHLEFDELLPERRRDLKPRLRFLDACVRELDHARQITVSRLIVPGARGLKDEDGEVVGAGGLDLLTRTRTASGRSRTSRFAQP